MLTKVEIQGFQNHPDTTLEFVPGTNVIIGPSDAGKSAVFRAINWVVTNRPLGEAFRSEWGGDTRVALHTSEGYLVERVKTASRNEYILNGETLKAFGSGVPEAVAGALQLVPANIQSQMDMPFLLADSPGEAARALNQAASIDEIDHAVSGLRKSYYSAERLIRDRERQVEQYQGDLEQYDGLPEQEKKLEEAERVADEIAKRQGQLTAIEQLQGRGDTIRKELAAVVADAALPMAETAEADRQMLSIRERDLATLQELTDHARDIHHQLDQMAPDAARPTLQKAEAKQAALRKSQDRLDTIKDLVTFAQKQRGYVNKHAEYIEAIEQEYHELAPEECPLCGGRLNEANQA